MADDANSSHGLNEAEVKTAVDNSPAAAQANPAPASSAPAEPKATVEPKVEEKVASPAKISNATSSHANEDSHETEQVVVFKLSNEEYAAPILDVQEIIPTGDITNFPNVPEYIAGIINVRGTVATVINLSKRFNLTRKDTDNIDRYIILTKSEKALYGVMVDEVTSVMKIPKSDIRSAASSEGKLDAEYISGVAVVEDRVILILDFKKILDEEAISSFADQTKSGEVK